jgi:hypothetical protein
MWLSVCARWLPPVHRARMILPVEPSLAWSPRCTWGEAAPDCQMRKRVGIGGGLI